MANKNYVSGRNFEYATQREYERKGYNTVRAAGSHGVYDVIAFHKDKKPVFIQCKAVTTEAQQKKLIADFTKTTAPAKSFEQVIRVKLKGTKNPTEVIV